MDQVYCKDKQLIKDFIKWVSDEHKVALICFPDEFSSNQFINYIFVNNGQLIEEFVNEKVKVSKE